MLLFECSLDHIYTCLHSIGILILSSYLDMIMTLPRYENAEKRICSAGLRQNPVSRTSISPIGRLLKLKAFYSWNLGLHVALNPHLEL